MSNAEIILQYCKMVNEPISSKQIINACFPGKPQPYINSTINNLIQKKELVRNDNIRPYTVRIPTDGEDIPQPRDYSRGIRYVQSLAGHNNTDVSSVGSCIKITVGELEEIARRVNIDPRYGEEATIIKNCLINFLKMKTMISLQ